MAYAKERVPETHLGVMAYSMGASIAIIGSAQSDDVEALVLDSAFASHWSVIDYHVRRAVPLPSAPFVWMADQVMWWRAKYHFHQVEPLRDIRKLAPRPILLIHGGKDSVVDPHDATLLYEAAGEPKELWFFPEAEHCGAYFMNRVAYCEKVAAFFELYLKKPRLQLVEPEPEEKVDVVEENLSEAS